MIARSIRWRLLLAFLGISGFAVFAALAALAAFGEVSGLLDRVVEKRVPASFASLELSRQAERMAAAGSTLLTSSERGQHALAAASVRAELGRLRELLREVRVTSAEGVPKAIEAAVEGLDANLAQLDRLTAERLDLGRQRERLLRRLSLANIAADRLVAPGTLVIDAQVAQLQRSLDLALPGPSRDMTAARLADEIAAALQQQKARVALGAINDALVRGADSALAADLELLAFPLRRSLSALEALAEEFEPTLKRRLAERIAEFKSLAEGPASLPSLRLRELDTLARSQTLVRENRDLSTRLTIAVDDLVERARGEIRRAAGEVRTTQHDSTTVLLGVVVLSLASSAAIVWLYVDRSIVRRLSALGDAMLAIAGGNVGAPLPEPSGDEIGRMAQALRVFRDTAVEIEEQNLRAVAEARQRLIDAIESISEGFALYDPQDRLILSNQRFRERAGIAAGTAGGQTFEQTLRALVASGRVLEARGDPEAWIAVRLDQHRSPREPQIEHRADGSWLMVSERKVAGGSTVAVYTDITELKDREARLAAAKEQAEAANRAKSDFLASMSHELRTPLNAIIGITEMLLEDTTDGDDPHLEECLRRVAGAAKLLLALINEVLDLAKIEAGKLELQVEPFALEPLLLELADTARTLAERRRNRLVLKTLGTPGIVETDPVRLRQIVLNLLSNACKFTNNGTITLSVRRDHPGSGAWIEIAVSDTGIGIAAADMKQLFVAFTQLEPPRKRHHGGTGLGLVISRRLARQMGGEVQVVSRPGRGSTFTLRIPAAAPAMAAAA